jgi:heme exporter protein C
MIQYFNTQKFLNVAKQALPFMVAIAVISFIYSIYEVFYISPPDYQQGETVKIMYIHVPSAWLAMGIYSLIAGLSFGYLVWRNILNHIICGAIAPVGFIFTLITLITGSLWGKPMWGAWWVWDARLTSMLILLFIYAGYMAIYREYADSEFGAKACAIISIIGFINIPIIKFSVDLWNSLHQPASLIRFDGPAIHFSMLKPLISMMIMNFAIFIILLVIRTENMLFIRKIKRNKIAHLGE